MKTIWKEGVAPELPYYAVIFISQKGDELEGYREMDDFLMEEAQRQEGFLGYTSNTRPEGGIFISYWKDENSIDQWRNHMTHQKAKKMAYAKWYSYLHTLITKVECSHIFERELEKIK